MNFDRLFGIHEQALQVQNQRTRLLAENLANSDTPGYKARDLDFREVLRNVDNNSSEDLRTTSPLHIQSGSTFMGQQVQYRLPQQPSIDGNTVESHTEMAAFTDNAMRYMATLRFINGKISTIMSAIRGE